MVEEMQEFSPDFIIQLSNAHRCSSPMLSSDHNGPWREVVRHKSRVLELIAELDAARSAEGNAREEGARRLVTLQERGGAMFTRLDERSTSAAVTWLSTSLRSAGAGLAASDAKRMRQEFSETEFTRCALHPAPAIPQSRSPAMPNYAQRPTPNAQPPDSQCPSAQCPTPNARLPVPNATCPLTRLREAVDVQQRWMAARLARRSSALPSRLRALCYEVLQRYTQRCSPLELDEPIGGRSAALASAHAGLVATLSRGLDAKHAAEHEEARAAVEELGASLCPRAGHPLDEHVQLMMGEVRAHM